MKWLQKIWIVLAVGGGLLFWYFIRRKKGEAPDLKHEMKLIDAKFETKRLLIERDKFVALQAQDEKHQEILEKMDEEDKEQAKILEADPVERHAFILNTGKRQKT